VDREAGELGYCRVPAALRVASSGPHFGEERPLVGSGGSGTVFLAGCNLLCVFCQNSDLSHGAAGAAVGVEDLAGTMLALQRRGCHNVNLVTPTHYAAPLAEAIRTARHAGLTVPVVWNSGGYDAVETLRLLDGLVEIYMPDLKFVSREHGDRYAQAADYWDVARAAVREMHRQVGDLAIRDGLAVRGLLVRHLVMPGGGPVAREIVNHLAAEISPTTYVNLMAQYRPCFRADRFPELAAAPDPAAVAAVRDHARRLGLRVDQR
jgi:putative pyruvate formate lyase activating enzyme